MDGDPCFSSDSREEEGDEEWEDHETREVAEFS